MSHVVWGSGPLPVAHPRYNVCVIYDVGSNGSVGVTSRTVEWGGGGGGPPPTFFIFFRYLTTINFF